MINEVTLQGWFQDAEAHTDQTVTLQPCCVWKEKGQWFVGNFIIGANEFIRVRAEHDYFEKNPDLFEQCQERVIIGRLHPEISRGTGVISHYIDIVKVSKL